jgi:hypothetical protein
MAASIAHELNQPLASIVTNGNAGIRWLDRPEPNLDLDRNPTEPWHFVQSFDDIAKGRECSRYASVEGRNAFLQLFDCAEMLGKKQVGLSNGCQTTA